MNKKISSTFRYPSGIMRKNLYPTPPKGFPHAYDLCFKEVIPIDLVANCFLLLDLLDIKVKRSIIPIR